MRKDVLAFALALSVIGGAGAIFAGTAAASDDEAFCPLDVARAWVADNPELMPDDLAGLELHSVTYRRAILGALPLDTRASIWQENISSVILRQPELTGDQIGYLEDLREELPRYFVDPIDRDALDALTARTREILGDEIAADAIAIAGAPEPVSTDSLEPDCECSVASDYCSISQVCGGGDCNRSTGGECGTLGLFICDGMCGLA